MLSAGAYSFRQKSRLAISLSWVGGYVNVVAFMVCGAVASHVTGNVTHLGRFVAQGNRGEALFMGYMFLAFFAGAVCSAVLTEIARRQGIASKYIPAMACEAGLLSLLAIAIRDHPIVDLTDTALVYYLGGLAAFAMGLQNATITKISGAVIRTTHLTGVTTDLGIESVQYLMWYRDLARGRRWSRAGRVLKVSHRHPSFQRVMLLASILGSFLFGAAAGTFIFDKYPGFSLLLPVSFLCWIVYVDWRTPIADVRELDLMADSELKLLGIMKSLLPPELGIWRVSCRQNHKWHKAPDFMQWAEKIPARWRVIILALSPLTRFNSNSILDLESALEKLHREGRKLILSGITPGQYRNLMKQGIGRSMDLENLCPDLEFAVARGIDLVQTIHPAADQGGGSVTSAA
ncbi:MAG: putative transrane protein [Phycisphaerales bacterium]|nr:putative transrane protein [Phycisphaerales bacterium]